MNKKWLYKSQYLQGLQKILDNNSTMVGNVI